MSTIIISRHLRLTARGAAELERMRRRTREALERMQGEGEDALYAAAPEYAPAPEPNGRTLSP